MNVDYFRTGLISLVVWMGLTLTGYGQTTPADTTRTKEYAIEVAGIKVGTMTVSGLVEGSGG